MPQIPLLTSDGERNAVKLMSPRPLALPIPEGWDTSYKPDVSRGTESTGTIVRVMIFQSLREMGMTG
jgi:hypothetical protein